MSRPGFVFDVTTESIESSVSYHCRSCGGTEVGGPISQRTLLHARMKTHLTERHHLAGMDEWKVTVQERNPGKSVACFWPPEAL